MTPHVGAGVSFSTINNSANKSFNSVGTTLNGDSREPSFSEQCSTPRISLNESFQIADEPDGSPSRRLPYRSTASQTLINDHMDVDEVTQQAGNLLPPTTDARDLGIAAAESTSFKDANAVTAGADTAASVRLRDRLIDQSPFGEFPTVSASACFLILPGNTPPTYNRLPLRLRYEILRLSLWTSVPVADLLPNQLDSTADYPNIWRQLTQNKALQGKDLPPPSRAEAWNRAGSDFDQVLLSGQLVFNERSSSPVFKFVLEPLRVEYSHRLGRRFGFDRYLRILLPLPNEKVLTGSLGCDYATAQEQIINWITASTHTIAGREWEAFFINDHSARKRGPSKKGASNSRPSKEVLLFAVDGSDFLRRTRGVPSKGEPPNAHKPMSAVDMLKWLIPFESNRQQPYLKLFSRIGLGETIIITLQRAWLIARRSF